MCEYSWRVPKTVPKDKKEIRYTATVTHDTSGLFGVMTDSVEIPVRSE